VRAQKPADSHPPGRNSPLFWRVLALNAAVVVVACVVTLAVASPRKISELAGGEALVLGAALLLIAAANLVLLRRAFAPLARVTKLTGEVDPTRPGQRVPVEDDRSEPGQLATA
jgi:two-component system, NarL family, sensor histidine kinase UhpB